MFTNNPSSYLLYTAFGFLLLLLLIFLFLFETCRFFDSINIKYLILTVFGSGNRQLLSLDVNECMTNQHNCHEDAYCNNTKGSWTCFCNFGYDGNGTDCRGILGFFKWYLSEGIFLKSFS